MRLLSTAEVRSGTDRCGTGRAIGACGTGWATGTGAGVGVAVGAGAGARTSAKTSGSTGVVAVSAVDVTLLKLVIVGGALAGCGAGAMAAGMLFRTTRALGMPAMGMDLDFFCCTASIL